jgi:hypothetical protein
MKHLLSKVIASAGLCLCSSAYAGMSISMELLCPALESLQCKPSPDADCSDAPNAYCSGTWYGQNKNTHMFPFEHPELLAEKIQKIMNDLEKHSIKK